MLLEGSLIHQLFERICKSRFAFIEDATWDEAGLPKTNINNIKEDK